jgi:hypothetical protein
MVNDLFKYTSLYFGELKIFIHNYIQRIHKKFRRKDITNNHPGQIIIF